MRLVMEDFDDQQKINLNHLNTQYIITSHDV